MNKKVLYGLMYFIVLAAMAIIAVGSYYFIETDGYRASLLLAEGVLAAIVYCVPFGMEKM